jgi:hypothetical protein
MEQVQETPLTRPTKFSLTMGAGIKLAVMPSGGRVISVTFRRQGQAAMIAAQPLCPFSL